MKTAAVLNGKGLTFHYPQRELFNAMSLHVLPGITLVRGGDGRGKSTLLRLMAGDIQAQSGDLVIHGISLAQQPLAYKSQVFWTDPRSSSFDQVTALAYFESLMGRYPQWDEALMAELYAGLSLAPHGDKPLYMLSTGSKRKVWLAAAFASGAALTLLDEPFAALDKVSILFVRSLLKAQAMNPARAWVVASYEAPDDVPLVDVIDLGD
jgi:ABC-type multidrug transport system ATPase subunit